jgi:hypothetical protein
VDHRRLLDRGDCLDRRRLAIWLISRVILALYIAIGAMLMPFRSAFVNDAACVRVTDGES